MGYGREKAMKTGTTPAFPNYPSITGMTLCQWYTGLAMQGILAAWNNPHCECNPPAVAARAVCVADAIIKKEQEDGTS